MKKAVPIGFEDLKVIINKNLYYVDKTLMIKDLLDSPASVTLFTRPRRFGKTLNLSMLRRFFEDERTREGEPVDNRYLFDGLAISDCGDAYLQHQQQYPVINLSLKSAKQKDYEMAYGELKKRVAEEFKRHQYVLEGDILSEKEKVTFCEILNLEEDASLYLDALRFLSECLFRYHEKKAVILIDEYDVPLENAYFEGFYDKMIGFIRSLFESALKTNPFLEFGVITGCLRISRESIFTGLNNLEVHSLLDPYYGSSFGFTEEEVVSILDYYGLSDKYPELKAWYDGYRFGDAEIYNPWSILNYVKAAIGRKDSLPKPYWSNTSSNSIIRELVETADGETRRELEALMDGGTIEKPVHEEITYGDIHTSQDNLWNFLFFTGYLKACGERLDGETIYLKMSIPNKEIKSVYRQSIVLWFDQRVRQMDRIPLLSALEEGDCTAAADFISEQLLETISYFDYGENYYHGFLAGLLSGFSRYQVLSNRESGMGRADLILKTDFVRTGRAMILELKVAKTVPEMEERCRQALQQIEEKQYEVQLRKTGYPTVDKYGICFYRKECIVMKG